MPATTKPDLPLLHRLSSRVRGPTLLGGLPLLVIGLIVLTVGDPLVATALLVTGVVLMMIGMPLHLVPLATGVRPVDVEPPVTGRWLVANSPADGTPSHGTNGHGQSFAIDFVYEPHDGARPESRGLGFGPPDEYPAFGRDVLAPADGTVVAAHAGARDHRARTSGIAYAFMLVEGTLREAFGSRPLIGNHVTIDLGDGLYACMAHLQRGSITVREGERVRAGQVIGRCGNSGNSTEPHVHFQLMDRPRPFFAAGIPFAFPRLATPERPTGVPPNDEHLDVPERPAAAPAAERETVTVGGT